MGGTLGDSLFYRLDIVFIILQYDQLVCGVFAFDQVFLFFFTDNDSYISSDYKDIVLAF